MSAPARKVEIREANEALILNAAEKVFALHGYRGATTEMIAREAGLPKANVHYYFGTKAKLYRQVLKDVLDDWMAAASTFEAYDDPRRALSAYIEAKMAFSRQRPCGSRVWAKEIMSGAPVIEGFLGTTLKSWVEERTSIIRGWIREERIRPVDPLGLLYMIWATTQHYADFDAQLRILEGESATGDRAYRRRVRQVVDLILGSVGLDQSDAY